jgi:hypothetical protein
VHLDACITDIFWTQDGDDATLPGDEAGRPHLPPRAPDLAGAGVVVRAITETGGEDLTSFESDHDEDDEERSKVKWFAADRVIVTLPFSALRFVRNHPSFSYGKRIAIRMLHYDAATKVLLEFSRRWWEFDADDWAKALTEIEASWPNGGPRASRAVVTSATTRTVSCISRPTLPARTVAAEWPWPATPGPTTPDAGTREPLMTATPTHSAA